MAKIVYGNCIKLESFPFATNFLLVLWFVNVFTGRGTSRNGSYFRCFSMERLGNTAAYHSTWPTHTNKAGQATFTAHYETHTTYQ
jgi:hypothetical protein